MGSPFIELHIKCNNETDKDDELRDLGLDVPSKTEYRPLTIRHELIDGFYPDKDGGCFMFFAGAELTIEESYKQVKTMINAAI
jgi:hypothetical protein